MITPRLRPPLRLTASVPPAELSARVAQRLEDPASPCRGLATERQIDLRIRPADRRFWSPQLVALLEPDGDGTSVVGHFGPNANVWTMFMAAYASVVISAIVGAGLGFAQVTIHQPAWGLWAVPAAAVLVVLIYAAAGIGQRLGHDQVDILQQFLEDAAKT